MTSRTWIKIYCDPWLEGSIRKDPLELRGLWVDLLVLAGSGKYGDTGTIKVANETGYSDSQICKILAISARKWSKLKSQLTLSERITVDSNNIITIVNWQKYQSEYERQRPYREAKRNNQKLQPQVTGQVTEESKNKNKKEIIIEGEVTNNIFKVYMDNVHPSPSPMEIEDLKALSSEYTEQQIISAIKEAVSHDARSLAYIKKVLKNKRPTEGRPGW